MKKINPTDKNTEPKTVVKSLSQIKFNLSAHNLACFKGTPHPSLHLTIPKPKAEQLKPLNLTKSPLPTKSTPQPQQKSPLQKPQEQQPSARSRAISATSSTFNQQVVIMQYDNIDVYIDNSTGRNNSSSSRLSPKDVQDLDTDDFLESCVRVITEETDNTSNTMSLSLSGYNNYHRTLHPHPQIILTSRSSQLQTDYDTSMHMYNPYPHLNNNLDLNLNPNNTRNKATRNRQSITIEQSKRFLIDYNNIETDQRTTVMVKNIPNKYSQEMLLEEFTINYENKFDFFYLPIDKDNDCNVGYAFVNFVNTRYLKQFYQEFHQQKWKQYKSPKICNICYARYQGTMQLADHFKHTKIINQKDRKIKPLIGITEASRIRDIREIVKNQRKEE